VPAIRDASEHMLARTDEFGCRSQVSHGIDRGMRRPLVQMALCEGPTGRRTRGRRAPGSWIPSSLLMTAARPRLPAGAGDRSGPWSLAGCASRYARVCDPTERR
jgi:hypothetical protein